MAENNIGSDAPEHICQSLVNVTNGNISADNKLAEQIAKRVAEGTITKGDAERAKDGMNAPEINKELFDYCRGNCTAKVGGCAMDGYGKALVGADYDALSPKEKALYEFYRSVMISRMTMQMADGVFLG